MAVHRVKQVFTVVPKLASTVGKCRKTNAHPRLRMRDLCGKIGQSTGNRSSI